VKLSPDRRLMRWAVVWLVLALASVPLLGLRIFVPAAGVLLCAAILADAWLALREPALTIERRAPEKGSRGHDADVELILTNPLRRGVELEVRESVPRDLIEREPIWEKVRIEANGATRLCYVIRPRVRGRRAFGAAVGMSKSPLGLLRRRVVFDGQTSILVHPETERFLRPEALDPKRVLATLGVRPRRRRGDGLDFESLREYVIGDEPRRIDWRATARRGRPIVRTHRHEESRTVLLALDCSRLMAARAPSRSAEGPGRQAGADRAHAPSDASDEGGFASTKLDYAVDAALALAFASLAAGDRVGLILFDRRVRSLLTPISGRANLGFFVDALSGVQPSPVEADYRRVTREILTRQRKRAMLIVLTDFIEVEREELLHPMGLLARRHEVVFVALREPILDGLDVDRDEAGADAVAGDASRGLYRRIVLADLLRERENRLVSLRRQGLSVLDVPPAEATAATLNRFLELRYGAV
jgi:uncharacterized protein (DUF58 family)